MLTSDIFSGVKHVSDIFNSVREVQKNGHEQMRISMYVDETAPADVVGWVRDAFVPEGDTVTIDVERIAARGLVRIHTGTDVAIVVAGSTREVVGALVESFVEDRLPVALIGESSLDMPELKEGVEEDGQLACIAASSEAVLRSKLSSWLVATFPDDLALAANFSFVRASKATQLISTCATENLIVSLLGFFPSAQMPIMTANQLRLAVNLAGIYGTWDASKQIPQFVAIVAGGYVLRGVARAGSRALPGLGFVVRCATATGGTYAMGKMVQMHMEHLRLQADEPLYETAHPLRAKA